MENGNQSSCKYIVFRQNNQQIIFPNEITIVLTGQCVTGRFLLSGTEGHQSSKVTSLELPPPSGLSPFN